MCTIHDFECFVSFGCAMRCVRFVCANGLFGPRFRFSFICVTHTLKHTRHDDGGGDDGDDTHSRNERDRWCICMAHTVACTPLIYSLHANADADASGQSKQITLLWTTVRRVNNAYILYVSLVRERTRFVCVRKHIPPLDTKTNIGFPADCFFRSVLTVVACVQSVAWKFGL